MIWCVEDDASIRDIEIYALKSIGFEARGFEDGASFCEAIKHEKPELIVLDVMLPGADGIQILRQLKASAGLKAIPVVMATAKGEEYDKIQGLDSGADYYLTKPFGVMEFISCIKAVLRRCTPIESANILKSGGVILNIDKRKVTVEGEEISLTYKEFELLKLLLSHKGTVFNRDRIFNEIWGMDYCGETRTVDMHIRTLRHKLKEYGRIIKTVRNVGYKLEEKS